MQFAPLVLKDRTGTDIVFAPRDIANGVATHVNSTGVPIADKRLSYAQTRTAGNGRTKLSYKLAVPVVQDVNVGGVSRPTVVRSAYVDLTVTFDATSSVTERQDVRNMLLSFLGTEMAGRTIESLETLY